MYDWQVDSPGGEELGGLRDGEREERRDKRVVHPARCGAGGGRPHLEAPLPTLLHPPAGGGVPSLPRKIRIRREEATASPRRREGETDRVRTLLSSPLFASNLPVSIVVGSSCAFPTHSSAFFYFLPL